MYYFPISEERNKRRITLEFGSSAPPHYSPAKRHVGVDLAPYPGSYGEPVTLPWDAECTGRTESTKKEGYGNYLDFSFSVPFAVSTTTLPPAGVRTLVPVTIPAHTELEMRMAHFQKMHVGQGALEAGTIVGDIGDTGEGVGAHLHLEIRQKQGDWHIFLDPMPFLDEARRQNSLPKEEDRHSFGLIQHFVQGGVWVFFPDEGAKTVASIDNEPLELKGRKLQMRTTPPKEDKSGLANFGKSLLEPSEE